MDELLEQVMKDFENMKLMKSRVEKQEVISKKIEELGVLGSEYNTVLDAAITDETLLANAISIKQAMIEKQAEINELNKQ